MDALQSPDAAVWPEASNEVPHEGQKTYGSLKPSGWGYICSACHMSDVSQIA